MADELHIETKGDQTVFRPGDTVAGSARWRLDEAGPIELRPIWFTRGIGSRDSAIVETVDLGLVSQGERGFSFQLPAEPYSFSGSLVSLVWGLELVAGARSELIELVLSPTTAAVDL